jgi:uncharacterized protein
MFRSLCIALLAFVAQIHPSLAQSFDCKKAATPAEHLICADAELQKLDSALNEKLRAALNAALAERERLLAEERHWVAERDKKCPTPKGELAASARDAATQCLRSEYEARIAAIETVLARQRSERGPDKALCQTFIDRYRAMLDAKPRDAKLKTQGPYELLTNAPTSGVVVGPKPDEIDDPKPAALEAWARRQTPSFKFSPKVVSAMNDFNPGLLTLSRAPGLPFYSAGSIGGTAHCLTETYFEVKDGVAQRAGELPWGENEAACGVDREFGTIDGRVVAFEIDGYGYQPLLRTTVSIMKWDRDFFNAPCHADFDYAPEFKLAGDDEMPEDQVKCESAACLALRQEAIALIEAIHRNPREARKAVFAKLSEPQHAQFSALEKLAPEPELGEPVKQDAENEPSSLLDTNPLLVPFVHRGEVYLASVGHRTIGWRTFPDWGVALAQRDKDKLKPAGWVGVSMEPGRLSKASVR